MSSDDRVFAILLAPILALVMAVALGGCGRSEVRDMPTFAAGQPLDAIRYQPPKWSAGDSAWRVTDRQTGDEWWLVEMECSTKGDRQWVVLPRMTHGGE